jgi:hypothetical protein
MSDAARVMVVNHPDEHEVVMHQAHRLGWGGILAGVLAGLFTYVSLLLLGVAIGFIGLESVSLSGVALGAVIWLGLSLAAASFLGGLTAARAVGDLTPARGRFNGLVVGILLMILMSVFTANIISRGVSAITGLAGSVVGTAANVAGSAAGAANANGGVGGILESLGVGNEYQALVSGFNEQELTSLIAEASPELNETQVAAAVAVVGDELQAAGQNIANNIADISSLDEIVTRQADNVQTALSGPEFVQNLVAQGLSDTQAQEVSTVINERVGQARQQIQETATAVRNRAEELAQTAARTAARAAWVWLLLAGITLGFATLGGGRGKDVDPSLTTRTTVRT